MTSITNHAESCRGCLRPKIEDEEVQCVRCATEMCEACFSVSPVEGDEDAYCKRCAQERLDEEETSDEDDSDNSSAGECDLCDNPCSHVWTDPETGDKFCDDCAAKEDE